MDRSLRLAAILTFSLLAFSLLDSCTAIGDRGKVVRGLRGAPILVSGDLDSSGPELERLSGMQNDPKALAENILYETDNVSGILVIQELSGRMWRGTYQVSDDTRAGTYHITVHQKGVKVGEGTSRVAIRVFENETDMRADMETFSERLFGFKPWIITLMVFPCCLLLLYYSYKASILQEEALQAKGMSTIFKMARSGKGWEIAFNLGKRHGVHQGSLLSLLDPSGNYMGTIEARDVYDTSTMASVEPDVRIKASYLVSINIPGSGRPQSDGTN